MMFTDSEAMLMSLNNRDRNYAARQINLANGEIRRLRAELAQAQSALEDERAARLYAEYQLNKRH